MDGAAGDERVTHWGRVAGVERSEPDAQLIVSRLPSDQLSSVASLTRAWFLMSATRAKGPLVCLAQPNGLVCERRRILKGQRPGHLSNFAAWMGRHPANGRAFSPPDKPAASIPRPLAWAGQIAGPSARGLEHNNEVGSPRLFVSVLSGSFE